MMGEDSTPDIDLNPNHWVEVRRILRVYVPEYEVWAFGSRAKWTAKPYSDLDLAILTDKPLSLQKAAELRSALDESTLPIRVDFVDWAASSESFRKIIEADKVVVLRTATGLSGWKFKRLIDCTVDGILSYGIVQPGQYDESGIPIVRVNNISTGQLHVDEPMLVSPGIEANYQRTRLAGGEVLLTVVGTTGQSAIVPKALAGWNVARAVAVIRPKPEIGASWIHICLQSKAVQQFLDERANTTVQKTLNLGDVKEVLIPIPPPGVKEAIESIAVGLDDKIELNRRMNATLEAMARALFQSWFVDFDPVRAKLDGRAPAALDPTIAALFPEHLEDSPLGHIPKSWKACPLAELIEVVKGRSYRSEELAESKTALVTLKSFLRGGGYRTDGLKPFTGEYKPNQLVHPGDLVVAFTDVTQAADVIGKPALVRSDDRFETLVASLDVGIVRPKSKHVSIPFLYCLFLTAEFQAHTYAHATGTTVLHLGSTAIPSFVSVVPPVDIAEKFAERADPIFRLIDENAKQSRTLATLRDTLLPKLLSGELSVQGATN